MAESIDIVFVSNAVSPLLWAMTNNAIRSARERPGYPIGEVFVIEQNLTAMKYPKARTEYYNFEFNYNKCLNLGLFLSSKREKKSQYIAFCNNDLLFSPLWARNAIKALKEYNALSCSPTYHHIFKGVIEGYRVGRKGQLYGWCIIVDRKVFDYIGQFDEVVNFWFSDDVYSVQLECAGLRHILVGNSRVTHFTSRTDMKIKNGRTERRLGQQKIFEQYKKQMYDKSIEIKTERGHSN